MSQILQNTHFLPKSFLHIYQLPQIKLRSWSKGIKAIKFQSHQPQSTNILRILAPVVNNLSHLSVSVCNHNNLAVNSLLKKVKRATSLEIRPGHGSSSTKKHQMIIMKGQLWSRATKASIVLDGSLGPRLLSTKQFQLMKSLKMLNLKFIQSDFLSNQYLQFLGKCLLEMKSLAHLSLEFKTGVLGPEQLCRINDFFIKLAQIQNLSQFDINISFQGLSSQSTLTGLSTMISNTSRLKELQVSFSADYEDDLAIEAASQTVPQIYQSLQTLSQLVSLSIVQPSTQCIDLSPLQAEVLLRSLSIIIIPHIQSLNQPKTKFQFPENLNLKCFSLTNYSAQIDYDSLNNAFMKGVYANKSPSIGLNERDSNKIVKNSSNGFLNWLCLEEFCLLDLLEDDSYTPEAITTLQQTLQRLKYVQSLCIKLPSLTQNETAILSKTIAGQKDLKRLIVAINEPSAYPPNHETIYAELQSCKQLVHFDILDDTNMKSLKVICQQLSNFKQLRHFGIDVVALQDDSLSLNTPKFNKLKGYFKKMKQIRSLRFSVFYELNQGDICLLGEAVLALSNLDTLNLDLGIQKHVNLLFGALTSSILNMKSLKSFRFYPGQQYVINQLAWDNFLIGLGVLKKLEDLNLDIGFVIGDQVRLRNVLKELKLLKTFSIQLQNVKISSV